MLENFQGDSWGSIPPLHMPSLLPHDLCQGRSSLPTVWGLPPVLGSGIHPQVRRSPGRWLSWSGSWARYKGSGCLRLDWASVLVTPRRGRVSSLRKLLSDYLLCAGSGWMLYIQYLSVTDSDFLMQMRLYQRLKTFLESWSQYKTCLHRCPALTLPTVASNLAEFYPEDISGTSCSRGLPTHQRGVHPHSPQPLHLHREPKRVQSVPGLPHTFCW